MSGPQHGENSLRIFLLVSIRYMNVTDKHKPHDGTGSTMLQTPKKLKSVTNLLLPPTRFGRLRNHCRSCLCVCQLTGLL